MVIDSLSNDPIQLFHEAFTINPLTVSQRAPERLLLAFGQTWMVTTYGYRDVEMRYLHRRAIVWEAHYKYMDLYKIQLHLLLLFFWLLHRYGHGTCDDKVQRYIQREFAGPLASGRLRS